MHFSRYYTVTFSELIIVCGSLSIWMSSSQREFVKVKYHKNELRVLIIMGIDHYKHDIFFSLKVMLFNVVKLME